LASEGVVELEVLVVADVIVVCVEVVVAVVVDVRVPVVDDRLEVVDEEELVLLDASPVVLDESGCPGLSVATASAPATTSTTTNTAATSLASEVPRLPLNGATNWDLPWTRFACMDQTSRQSLLLPPPQV
jgi:hypothetical protein